MITSAVIIACWCFAHMSKMLTVCYVPGDSAKNRFAHTPTTRFSKTPAEVRTPGPLLGEHNEYLLGTLLVIPTPERERLESSGVTSTLFTDLG